MGTIVITSRLGEDYREDLEQVMFFNPKQHKAEVSIRDCVALYGVPEIATERGYLRIRFDSSSVAQTLYCIDRTEARDILAGAVVFVRNSLADISILHLAIAKKYILQGTVITARLVWDLLRQVIDSASHIRGVRNVKLAYLGAADKSRAIITSIPVKRSVQRKAIVTQSAGICPDEAITCYEFQHCNDCPEKVISKNCKTLIHQTEMSDNRNHHPINAT